MKDLVMKNLAILIKVIANWDIIDICAKDKVN